MEDTLKSLMCPGAQIMAAMADIFHSRPWEVWFCHFYTAINLRDLYSLITRTFGILDLAGSTPI